MSLTLTESQAVFDLLLWLADKPRRSGKVSDTEAIEALELLGRAAGRRLQMSPEARLPALIVERLRVADSDGAAQAVCRAIVAQWAKGGLIKIPWSSVREPFTAWALAHAELGERLREQTADAPAWGTVDV